ncbi:MAG TPA: xanthine dehydrogenase family protein molybdopterin-binding subunit [Burkholderiales bacterium]|nr:xanthine dehydrogenase family protein molybdopterin-binding subunit [Burkholderiales bacterium]
MIGQPVPRKEDERLLRGAGCYADDWSLPGQAYACMVRSPHAHARIRGLSAEAALRVPGVLAVLTGREAEADGLQPIPVRPVTVNPHEVKLENRDGSPIRIPSYRMLPTDKARFVGEAVAMVLAETAMAAKDGAEAVEVDYEPLAANCVAAAASEAPLVWEALGSNVLVDADVGDAGAAEAAFRRAAHVVRLQTTINRVTGVPLEPRCALAAFSEGRYTVHAPSGGVQRFRADIAAALGVPEAAVRFVARDVGGGYGVRNYVSPELVLVAWAAKRLGRPVKWRGERHECFLTDDHARDLAVQAELALDAEGNFLAFRSANTSNVGAHAVSFIPLTKGAGVSTSVYRLPCAALRARAVLTNTMSTSPYRAAGRPEVLFVIERLIDLAARRHGFDRTELRRRNLVRSFPYRNPQGLVYDSGDYAATQARALELAEWSSFGERRRLSRAKGRLRGIGMANYIELNTGAPRERAEITVRPEGGVDVVLGTISSGQGHETSFAQLIAEWLGVELSRVRLLAGDTDVSPVGGGTHSGRSMRMGAAVMDIACKQIIEQGRERAAERLEAAAGDIEFVRGRFRVKGTDRAIELLRLAPLAGSHDSTDPLPSFPFGCAVCEVEVDPATGAVEIVRYVSVDDVGRAVNPLILHGQAHGGIVAGVGQALWERIAYNPETGQLESASFMDYAMPRADQFPWFTTDLSEVPAASHPLGLRGGGEGGTTPALATVANAICDALDVEHIELPATPERVWRALHKEKP